ncbi:MULTISPECIES: molybdopterin-containing oxidoreductase family protein [Frankia]|nr:MULTISPECIES: molybdopterin dinucleotide binding domain-containing protein [Frankia]
MGTPVREVRTYCRICIAQCGTLVTVDGDPASPVVRQVRGDAEHPVSKGYTCAKGRALPALHHHPLRLEQPLLRDADGTQRPVDWDTLLTDLGGRLAGIVAEHGPDAVAVFYATGAAFDAAGRRTAERFFDRLGTRQKYSSLTIDSPAKPLTAEMVGGWPWLNLVDDDQECRLSLLVGINPIVSHGHTTSMSNPRARLRAQRERGELWVLDPRRTETARMATRHLQTRPGSDPFVLGFLVRELLADGADEAYLRAHASGVDDLARAVSPLDAQRAAAVSGVSVDQLHELLAAIRRAGRISVVTGTGATMAASANVTEWLRLALLTVTGSLDRPGGMWFHPGFLRPVDGLDLPVSPPEGRVEPGPRSRPELTRRFGEYPCAALVPEIEAGNVRALVVVGGNVASSFPASGGIRAALRSLEVCAVADVVETETTRLATHVLPSVGQLERADVPVLLDAFTDRVMSQRTAAVVPPVAERRPVWWSFARLAEQLGLDVLPRGLTWETADDDAIIDPIVARSRDPEALAQAPAVVLSSVERFGWVTGHVLPGGRWRLAPPPLLAQLAELLTSEPGVDVAPDGLLLVPRRLPRAMNSQLHDVRQAGATPQAELLVHPADAATAGITDGVMVRVLGAHGATRAQARVTDEIRAGTVSLPHGWTEPDVNRLTSIVDETDALTGMVRMSGIPVRLEPEV